jgi:gluconokinase
MDARIVVMGVSGCGKTTLGAALADRIGAAFIDGDDLHSPENVAKMTRGEPLTDEDRWPWLDAIGRRLRAAEGPMVIASSALRRRYRDRIRTAAGGPVLFIHLAGDIDLIGVRMRARQDHYMPPSLLRSQFDALEPPEPDENAFAVSIDGPPDKVLARALGKLEEVDGPVPDQGPDRGAEAGSDP